MNLHNCINFAGVRRFLLPKLSRNLLRPTGKTRTDIQTPATWVVAVIGNDIEMAVAVHVEFAQNST